MKQKVREKASFLSRHRFGLAIFFSTFIFVFASFGLVAANGEAVTPSDSHLVSVYADGVEEVIPTRASTVGELITRLPIGVGPADIVEPAPETPIDSDNFKVRVLRAQPTTIVDQDGTTLTLLSPYEDPRIAAEKAGFDIYLEDIVGLEYPGDPLTSRILGRKIVITRAKHVTVNLYGTSVEHRTTKRTVQDVLDDMHIRPAADDTVQPAPDSVLTSETRIFITKFGKQVVNVEEEIAFPTETTDDPGMSVGTVKVIETGAKGRKISTYELSLENGVESARRLIQESIVTQPKIEKVVRGTRPLFADFNADGIPARVFCGSPKQGSWKNINVGNAAAGRALAAERGWTGSEFDALLELFACESSWNEKAGNPFSGAYGIPQALPATKMASFGADYLTNPLTQIRWGLNYIAGRYGSPSAALAFHYQKNWY